MSGWCLDSYVVKLWKIQKWCLPAHWQRCCDCLWFNLLGTHAATVAQCRPMTTLQEYATLQTFIWCSSMSLHVTIFTSFFPTKYLGENAKAKDYTKLLAFYPGSTWIHCKKLEVNLTQKRSSQLQSGFIIQFKMGYLSCRIYTTSHFYHSVGLQCLCTQSSNMAWILA